MDLIKDVLDRMAWLGGLLFWFIIVYEFIKAVRKGETPE